MAKQPFLQLGAWITFGHFYERPNGDEVEARVAELEGDDGTIGLSRRANPDPTRPAMVIGVCSVPAEATVRYWSEGENDGYFTNWRARQRDDGTAIPLRTFYVVKHGLRGRRFFVDRADVQITSPPRQKGA